MQMPKLGLGTWPMKGDICTAAVLHALDIGYRHIDTARMYGNEAAIGDAIAATSVKRDNFHLTTKVWSSDLAPDALRASLEGSLTDLKTDYVDLFLIHWPSATMDLPAALATMVRLQEEGLARAIGVSNFPVALMRQAIEEIGAPIMCNQVEYHVLLNQSKILAYARAHGVTVTAYCPLARNNLGKYPAMAAIAAKHGATPEQVALRWLLDQDGVAAVPKASQPANQQANLDALKLVLDDDDRAAIAGLPKDQRIVIPGGAPAWD
jgi:2,5-diketo-D-gluconate reductase B